LITSGLRAFKLLPLDSDDLAKTALLIVARKEHLVGLQVGAELRPLLPEPVAHEKLQAQVALYWDGLRSDLGIHGRVHYLFGVIRGDLRVGSQTEAEKRQDTSLRGGAAGAIFAALFGTVPGFFYRRTVGHLRHPLRRATRTRLLMGAVFGGATAKLVAMLMSLLGDYGDNLGISSWRWRFRSGVRQFDGILDVRRLERYPARQRAQAQAGRQYGNLAVLRNVCCIVRSGIEDRVLNR
jgi:hypothetical protein